MIYQITSDVRRRNEKYYLFSDSTVNNSIYLDLDQLFEDSSDGSTFELEANPDLNRGFHDGSLDVDLSSPSRSRRS